MPRPYNLYFTPDGRTAVVMVEQHNTIRFADPHTSRTIKDLKYPGCLGPNHADFSGNGRFFVVTCEFSGELLKVCTLRHRVLGVLHLDPHPTAPHADPMTMGRSVPQDVRISPDGRTFYVADMGTNELRLIDARTFRQRRIIGLPRMPHGLYPSRDGKDLYISDRGAGEGQRARLRDRTGSSTPGRSRVAAARTWAASRPTGGRCGSPAATTGSSTASTPAPAG